MNSCEPPTQQRPPVQLMVSRSMGSLSFNSTMSKELDEEMSLSALSSFRVKEEEIEKKKREVHDRVLSQLGRVEEEMKRLATIRAVHIYIYAFKLDSLMIATIYNHNLYFLSMCVALCCVGGW